MNARALSRLSKGQETRASILAHALALARRIGLEALSIGALAEAAGMSKSGVFAHFGSKEELQLAVLDAAQAAFAEQVFRVALAQPRGVARLRTLIERWLAWGGADCDGGCPLLAAAVEFDDRAGSVREAVVAALRRMRAGLVRTVEMCVEAGHFAADTDCEQIAFELYGLCVAAQHDGRLLASPQQTQVHALRALERLIRAASVSEPSAPFSSPPPA